VTATRFLPRAAVLAIVGRLQHKRQRPPSV
jgi:hypothetical protein